MTGNHCLLDTNIIIGLFANDPSIIEKLSAHTGLIFVPGVALGELFYGAQQSSKKEFNLKRIDEFAQTSITLPCDMDTARFYGIIKSALKQKGNPIPENDIWIAAIAQQHALTLVTRDKHFSAIESLQLDRW